jgi:hypothetical protein
MSANLVAGSRAAKMRVGADQASHEMPAPVRRVDEPCADRCLICDEVRGVDRDYATNALCDPARRESNAQAIADAIGFCSAHADTIAGLDLRGPAIAAVMRRAVRFTRALLESGPEFEDQRLDIFFRARHACPACRFSERCLSAPLARHAAWRRSSAKGGSRLLCLPHFRALIGVSETRDLPARTREQIEILLEVIRSGNPAAGLLQRRLAAGDTDVLLPDPRHGDSLRPDDEDCPVCAALRRALERWLSAARTAARIDIAAWAVLPACPEHILDCVRSGDERLADFAAGHAIDAALHSLQRGAEFLEREDRRLEAEKRSVWYRRKSPAYLLGVRRKALLGASRCAACERLAVTSERAIGEFLEHMRGARYRAALERRYGLCMKHFAQARVYAPAGVVRDTVTMIHAQKLAELERELGGAEPVSSSWREAIRRYSGSREIPQPACPS